MAESAVDPAPSAAAKAAAAKGQTMNITGELQTAQPMTHLGTIRTHPRGRTGVRFVLTNATDPGRPDDYSAWYDNYENAIIRPGLIANAFRFENPNAAGTPTDPRYAAIYDIVSPDPASAWPATENSRSYPRYLFDDPRRRLVAPALRASYPQRPKGSTMSGPFIFIATNRLREGKLAAERERAGELSSFIKASEPQLLAFNEYANEDGTEVGVVQMHPDAASMELHMEVVAERAADAYAHTLEATTSIQVFGEPSEAVLEVLRRQAGAGVPMTVKRHHIGGFSRIQ